MPRSATASTRLPLARWHLLRQQASRAALAGQFGTARDRSEEARQLAARIQDVSGAGMSYAFALSTAAVRGDAAVAHAAYDLFHPVLAHSGAIGSGLVVLYGRSPAGWSFPNGPSRGTCGAPWPSCS
jgi:hypothetical protein